MLLLLLDGCTRGGARDSTWRCCQMLPNANQQRLSRLIEDELSLRRLEQSLGQLGPYRSGRWSGAFKNGMMFAVETR